MVIDGLLLRLSRGKSGIDYTLYDTTAAPMASPAQLVEYLRGSPQGIRTAVALELPNDATNAEVAELVNNILRPARVKVVTYRNSFYDVR